MSTPGGAGADGSHRPSPHRPSPHRAASNRPDRADRRGRGGGAPRRRPVPDRPRRAAFDLLTAVRERDAYANLLLPALLTERGLTGRDGAFATELAFGTLRGRGSYDAVLAACVDRPLSMVDPPVLDLLRLGCHQVLAMRVPGHAAVSATVELARAVAGESRAAFVNAVLRRIATADLGSWMARVAPDQGADPIGHLAVTCSHPSWVVQAFADRLGSLTQTRAALQADNQPAQVTLVARPGRCTVQELLAAGGTPGRWSPYAVVWPGGDPGQLAQVRSGAAGVQDEGSQLMALALARAELTGADRAWLDLCAGPGGKSALLAGLAGRAGRGATVLSVDRSAHRSRLVRQALGPDPAGAVVQADGTAGPWPPGSFDRVLADVPCTGLGALRRRPDARWRRQPQDVSALGPVQRRLLAAAVDAARPGGVVAYSTCSPHLAETVDVVGDIVAARTDLQVLDARAALPPMPGVGPGPYVQLWPHLHGTDAMFLALLRRRG